MPGIEVGGRYGVAVGVGGKVGGGSGVRVAGGMEGVSGASASGWKGVGVDEGLGLGVTVGGRDVENAGAGAKRSRPAQPAKVQARTVRSRKGSVRDEVRCMSGLYCESLKYFPIISEISTDVCWRRMAKKSAAVERSNAICAA